MKTGLLTKAGDAKTKSDEAQIRERIQLAYHSALAGGQGSYTKESLETELKTEFETDYSVDDSNDEKWKLKAQGQEIEIPAGTKVVTSYLASEIFDSDGTTDGKMHIGDYINYEVDYSNMFADRYGASGSPTKDKYAGKWRVLNVSGNNIEIISAGIPIKYMFTTGTSANTAVVYLSKQFFDIYLNKDQTPLRGQFTCHGFKNSNGVVVNIDNNNTELINLFNNAKGTAPSGNKVRALQKQDIDRSTGQSGNYDYSSYYNGLFKPESLGSECTPCWLANAGVTDGQLVCISKNGSSVSEGANVSMGLRLVVTLDSNNSYTKSSTNINETQAWDIITD